MFSQVGDRTRAYLDPKRSGEASPAKLLLNFSFSHRERIIDGVGGQTAGSLGVVKALWPDLPLRSSVTLDKPSPSSPQASQVFLTGTSVICGLLFFSLLKFFAAPAWSDFI